MATKIDFDFEDIEFLMENVGCAHIAIGHGESTNKVPDALAQVFSNRLFEASVKNAKKLLIRFVLSENINKDDVVKITEFISELAPPDVYLIFCLDYDPELSDTINLVVIATDLNDCPPKNKNIKITGSSALDDQFYDNLWGTLKSDK